MAEKSDNIFHFPREVIVEQKIRNCRMMIDRLNGWIEDHNPNDLREVIRAETAPGFIEMWSDNLKEALAEKETLTADDALRFGGMVYRAYPSQRGAH